MISIPMIQVINCPRCGTKLLVPSEEKHVIVMCGNCGHTFEPEEVKKSADTKTKEK